MIKALEHFIHDAFVALEQKRQLDAGIGKIKEDVPSRKPKANAKMPIVGGRNHG